MKTNLQENLERLERMTQEELVGFVWEMMPDADIDGMELGALRQTIKEALVHEAKKAALAIAFESYTDPASPEYDKEFTTKIKAIRPDWLA
jgi:CHASE1-domain containing sensor protein